MQVTDIYNKWLEIIDKSGDPSWEDYEWTIQFNTATEVLLKDEFNNIHNRQQRSAVPYGFENTDIDMMKWKNQILPLTATSSADGKILWTALEQNKEIFHINSIERKIDGEWILVPVTFKRHNDRARLNRNYFTKPKENNPYWMGFSSYIQFEPEDKAEYRFSIFYYPKKVKIDFTTPSNNIDSDMTTSAINSVLFRMAQLNGIKIREQQLYEMAQQQELRQ